MQYRGSSVATVVTFKYAGWVWTTCNPPAVQVNHLQDDAVNKPRRANMVASSIASCGVPSYYGGDIRVGRSTGVSPQKNIRASKFQPVVSRDLHPGEMQVEAIAELETLTCIKQLNLICRSLQGLIDYSYVWVSGIQCQIIAPIIFLFNNNHTRAKIASSWLVALPDGMRILRRRVWYAEGCE